MEARCRPWRQAPAARCLGSPRGPGTEAPAGGWHQQLRGRTLWPPTCEVRTSRGRCSPAAPASARRANSEHSRGPSAPQRSSRAVWQHTSSVGPGSSSCEAGRWIGRWGWRRCEAAAVAAAREGCQVGRRQAQAPRPGLHLMHRRLWAGAGGLALKQRHRRRSQLLHAGRPQQHPGWKDQRL